MLTERKKRNEELSKHFKHVRDSFSKRLNVLAIEHYKGNDSALAVEVGVTRQAIARWRNAQNMPDMLELLKLCEVFGCEVSYMLGEYKERTRAIADICEVTGLENKAIEMLMKLSSYKEPENLHEVLQKHTKYKEVADEIDDPERIPQTLIFTADEIAMLQKYMQNEFNIEKSKAISQLISRDTGIELIYAISLFVDTDTDKKIGVDRPDGTRVMIDESGAHAQLVNEIMYELRKEIRGENNG